MKVDCKIKTLTIIERLIKTSYKIKQLIGGESCKLEEEPHDVNEFKSCKNHKIYVNLIRILS